MKIEIINENTVKFFVSNQDIEERGFTITEIWQNRQRGEQLLWDLIDEVQEQVEIEFTGALKIQVSASNLGLEFIIQISREDMNQKISQMLSGEYEEDDFQEVEVTSTVEFDDPLVANVNPKTFVFENFEDVIALHMYGLMESVESTIYLYNNRYHMHTKPFGFSDKKKCEGCQALILEFAKSSNVSEEILSEYGSKVIQSSVYEVVNKYFVKRA